jgi:restriction endonuclease S subunit
VNGIWQTKTIRELCEDVNVGHVGPSSMHRDPKGIPFLMGKNIGAGQVFRHNIERVTESFHRAQKKSQLRSGDIVVVRIGKSGQAAKIPDGFGEANCSGLVVIKQPHGIDPDFLVYYLNSPTGRRYSLSQAKGSTRQTLNTSTIAATEVPVPPLAEQQRIVRLLDEAFEGITIARANTEKNIQSARALFESYLQSVFRQSGNGWTDRALQEICSVSAGNSAPQDPGYFAEGTIPFFRTSDAGRIKFGTIYESQDKLNSHGASKLRRYPAGTILFPKSGASTFLNHRVVLGVEGCVSSHLATIVPDPDHVLPQFLLYALTLIDAKDLIQDQSYPSLNLPAIENIRIYLPPLNEQQQIVRLLNELQVITEKLARICSAKQASLEDLKESLLHQAFSGNLEAA